MTALYNKIYRLANNPKTWRMARSVVPYRLWIILCVHVLLFLTSYISSFLMLDALLPEEGYLLFWKTVPVLVLVRVTVFGYYDLFRGLWAFVSFTDLVNILRAAAISTLLFAFSGMVWKPFCIPQKIVLLDMFFCIMFVGGVRFLVRNFRENFVHKHSADDHEHVLLVGPVERVHAIVKDMLGDPYARFQPIGVVDPNQTDTHMVTRISDIAVCTMDYVINHRHLFPRLDSIVFCWPQATRKQLDHLVKSLEPLRIPYKTLPIVDDILSGNVSINDIRDVEIHDLLERPPIQISMDQIRQSVSDRVVLVTGGGGSIGSELCRQLAAFKPRLLVVVERSELNLLNLSLELKKDFPALPLHASISSVNDYPGLSALMQETKVDMVFHAAAYKHVPLMESAPVESAYNNILGTFNVAKAALESGVDRFVMISTDKAVNPTNVMGATKRIGEMVVRSFNSQAKTRFMVVRFGNVLGSTGSVIPIFKEQIARGGPVTVTAPDIERYFMTISEAVQLVLEAGCMGKGGEIFVFDMGRPVKILQLAEKLISLSGKRPHEDIEIVFSGIRPGEKMYEELFNIDEKRMVTRHPQIMTAISTAVNPQFVGKEIEQLRKIVQERDTEQLTAALQRLVPNYVTSPPARTGAAADAVSVRRSGVYPLPPAATKRVTGRR